MVEERNAQQPAPGEARHATDTREAIGRDLSHVYPPGYWRDVGIRYRQTQQMSDDDSDASEDHEYDSDSSEIILHYKWGEPSELRIGYGGIQ